MKPVVPPRYRQPEVKVTRAFRDGVLAAFPALTHHKNALVYRRLFQHLILDPKPFRDEDDAEAIVVDARTVAALVGRSDRTGKFCALDWLEAFARDVFALTIREHRFVYGLARSVRFEVPEPITALLLAEGLALGSAAADLVWWATGAPVTQSRAGRLARAAEAEMRLLADGVGEEHPAHALQRLLNEQPQVTVGKVFRSNLPAVCAAWEVMPETTPYERRRKAAAKNTLQALNDGVRMIYAASARTPRLHALGANLNGLPRELRKAAVRGCVTLDAAACQLAVVERLWALPELTRLLADGRSIWVELATHLDQDPQAVKPTCKRAVYAILLTFLESGKLPV